MTDKIGDLLTRIRNAQMVRHKTVNVLKTKMNRSILDILKHEGYIEGFEEQSDRYIRVALKYSEGRPAIRVTARVSKPGCRQYASVRNFKAVYNGLGMNVLSTSKGIMTDYEAVRQNVGGELLFKVF